ncbi:MAG: hypothetical protein IJ822_04380 [Pyramidobacter sp.]|nr:hypothetical protein [Pyramidobacter sp.]
MIDEDRLEEILDRIAAKVAERLEGKKLQQKSGKGLTAETVAQRLGITVGGLNRRIERGEFPHPAYGAGKGSTRIWLPEQLEGAARNISKEARR